MMPSSPFNEQLTPIRPGRRRRDEVGSSGARRRSAAIPLALGLLGVAILLLSSSSITAPGRAGRGKAGGAKRFLREMMTTTDTVAPRVVRRTSSGRWEFVNDPNEAAELLPPPPPPLSILALGGPSTAGVGLDVRFDAFPQLVGRNFAAAAAATSGSGSDDPIVQNLAHVDFGGLGGAVGQIGSACVEVVVRLANGIRTHEDEDNDKEATANHSSSAPTVLDPYYDVVILEQSLPSSASFLRDVRARYSSAVILYVDLRGLTHEGLAQLGGDGYSDEFRAALEGQNVRVVTTQLGFGSNLDVESFTTTVEVLEEDLMSDEDDKRIGRTHTVLNRRGQDFVAGMIGQVLDEELPGPEGRIQLREEAAARAAAVAERVQFGFSEGHTEEEEEQEQVDDLLPLSSPTRNANSWITRQCRELASSIVNRPLRILSVGGSNTFGIGLDPRHRPSQSYPHVVGSSRPGSTVINVSTPSTDAGHYMSGPMYPSMCIQSMVEKVERQQITGLAKEEEEEAAAAADGVNGSEGDGGIEYDVILVEFSNNGLEGLGRLLRRLRRRYPHSLIIYVELWSIYNNIRGKPMNHEITDDLRGIIDETGVFHYMLKPYPSTVLPDMHNGITVRNSQDMPAWVAAEPMVSELFTPDWHHLSSAGHRQVAEGVLRIIDEHLEGAQQGGRWHAEEVQRKYDDMARKARDALLKARGVEPEQEYFDAKDAYDTKDEINHSTHKMAALEAIGYDHTWGLGDDCHMWFYDEHNSPDADSPPPLVESADLKGGQFEMFTAGRWAYEVPPEGMAEITIKHNYNGHDGDELVYVAFMSKGNPSEYPAIDVLVNRKNNFRIDPLNSVFGNFHITSSAEIGTARTSKNKGELKLEFTPVEENEEPFRLLGVAVCGACLEIDDAGRRLAPAK